MELAIETTTFMNITRVGLYLALLQQEAKAL